jgi:hypothetical protein
MQKARARLSRLTKAEKDTQEKKNGKWKWKLKKRYNEWGCPQE